MSHTLTATDFELLDAGTYGIELARIGDPQDGDFGRFIRLTFKVRDAADWEPLFSSNGDEFELDAQASYKLGQKTKLRGWVEALLGRPLESGEELDLDSLVGKRALAGIIQREGTQGGTFNNIATIAPLPKKRAPAGGNGITKKPAAAAAAESDDEDVPF